jgi:superfamily I DNA/RNA helicase
MLEERGNARGEPGSEDRSVTGEPERGGPFQMAGERLVPFSGMERILIGLDADQCVAVTTTEGPVLVVAGPGSGKTRVLTHRVAYLIGSGRARPWQIVAVTFTNKAAREIRERLGGLLGTESAQLVQAGTFHSLCVRILRRDGYRIGLEPAFTIYDEEDQLALVKQALRDLGLDPQRFSPRMLLGRLSRAKNDQHSPSDLQSMAQSYWDEVAARVYERYAQYLQRAQAVDFDDLLLRTVELFTEYPDVLAHYQDRWRYLAAATVRRLRELGGELVRLRAAMVEHPASQLFDLALERSGLAARYRDASDPTERERWENLVQLRSVLERYDTVPAAEGLPLFLEEAALVAAIDEAEMSGDQVTLLTLHAAKGLEFPVVFLIGVEEGLLPHARALESEAELEEERRLFYVGITRAKERLYLSYCSSRNRFGLHERSIPSHFLDDLPPDVVERVGGRGWSASAHVSSSIEDRAPVATGGTVPVMPRLRAGQRVFHPRFGDGFVVAVREKAGDQEVTVQFKRHGTKTLLASLAKLVVEE